LENLTIKYLQKNKINKFYSHCNLASIFFFTLCKFLSFRIYRNCAVPFSETLLPCPWFGFLLLKISWQLQSLIFLTCIQVTQAHVLLSIETSLMDDSFYSLASLWLFSFDLPKRFGANRCIFLFIGTMGCL